MQGLGLSEFPLADLLYDLTDFQSHIAEGIRFQVYYNLLQNRVTMIIMNDGNNKVLHMVQFIKRKVKSLNPASREILAAYAPDENDAIMAMQKTIADLQGRLKDEERILGVVKKAVEEVIAPYLK